MDDFEEIIKNGLLRAACTIRCSEYRTPKGNKLRKRVSISFRISRLPAAAVEVLRSATLSAAYSPSQRVVRVRGSNDGEYHLAQAPKTKDVWFLRYPWKEGMPWVENRVAAEIDYNEEQRAVFIEIPGVTPPKAEVPSLPPLPSNVQRLSDERVAPVSAPNVTGLTQCAVPDVVASKRIGSEAADLLTVLSKPGKHRRDKLEDTLRELGHGSVSIPGIIARVRGLLDLDVAADIISSEKAAHTYWLSPQSQVYLRDLLKVAS